MGWCHEFGPQVNAGCDHPMTAGAQSCSCTACHYVCTGRFTGCAAVWARGSRPVTLVRPPEGLGRSNGRGPRQNGRSAPAPPGPLPAEAAEVTVIHDDPPHLAAAGGEIRGLLEHAIAGLRSELSSLATTLRHQDAILGELAQRSAPHQDEAPEPLVAAAASADRLAESVADLPDRITRAVADAIKSAKVINSADAPSPALAALPPELGETLAAIQASVSALTTELSQSETEQGPPETVTLAQLRASRGVTQATIAGRLRMSQPEVSRLEGRTDLRLSTLRAFVKAIDGELGLVVTWPGEPDELELVLGPSPRRGVSFVPGSGVKSMPEGGSDEGSGEHGKTPTPAVRPPRSATTRLSGNSQAGQKSRAAGSPAEVPMNRRMSARTD